MTTTLPLVSPLVAALPRRASRSDRLQVRETRPLALKLQSLGISVIPQPHVEAFMANKLKEIRTEAGKPGSGNLLGAAIFGSLMALAVSALGSFVVFLLWAMAAGIAKEGFDANLDAGYPIIAGILAVLTILACYACATTEMNVSRSKWKMMATVFHEATRWETTTFEDFVARRDRGAVPRDVCHLARRLQAEMPDAELAIHHIAIDPFLSIRLRGERYFLRQWG